MIGTGEPTASNWPDMLSTRAAFSDCRLDVICTLQVQRCCGGGHRQKEVHHGGRKKLNRREESGSHPIGTGVRPARRAASGAVVGAAVGGPSWRSRGGGRGRCGRSLMAGRAVGEAVNPTGKPGFSSGRYRTRNRRRAVTGAVVWRAPWVVPLAQSRGRPLGKARPELPPGIRSAEVLNPTPKGNRRQNSRIRRPARDPWLGL